MGVISEGTRDLLDTYSEWHAPLTIAWRDGVYSHFQSWILELYCKLLGQRDRCCF
jgi:hypothetical protein